MGWLARSLGDFGGQVGQGFDIAQTWQQRAQEMKMQQARQKLQELLGPLQLQDLQQRIKQANLPQYEGMVPTEGGGTGAVTWDPTKGTAGVQPLAGTKSKQKPYSNFRVGADGKLYGFNSDTNQEEAIQAPEGAAFPVPGQASKGKLTKGDYVPDKESKTGYSRQMVDGQGNVVKLVKDVIPPGTIPHETEGFAITQDEDGNVIMVPKTTVTRPARPGASASSGGTPQEGGAGKIIGHKDTPIQRDAVKASQQARDSYTNYQDAIKNSQSNNPRTNVALVISAARSMIAGAGRLNTTEIQAEATAGGFGEKFQRWMQMATSGTLPDDQRQEILEQIKNDYESKRAAGADAWAYSYPGKALPPWLRSQAPEMTKGATDPASQLPPNYVLDKKK